MGNEARRNPFNQAQARGEGPSTRKVYDQFGRVLAVGDVIIVPSKGGVLWQIQDIKADLRVDAPAANFHVVELAALDSIGGPGGRPLLGVLKVRDASDYLPAAAVGGMPDAEHNLEGSDGGPLPTSGPRLVTES